MNPPTVNLFGTIVERGDIKRIVWQRDGELYLVQVFGINDSLGLTDCLLADSGWMLQGEFEMQYDEMLRVITEASGRSGGCA